MGNLKKTIWLTGASSGIGFEVVKQLCRAGHKVYGSARSEDKLKELEKITKDFSGTFTAKPLDVTKPKNASEVAKSIIDDGDLNQIILNAGIYIPTRGEKFKRQDYEKSFQVNLSGVVNCLADIIPYFIEKKSGSIAIVSSVTAYGGLPTSAAYGATKAGLTNMAESLKFDLDNYNVKIQIIHPGFVDTPATQENQFEMPFLMQVEDAAKRIVEGIDKDKFEITFPKRFTYGLKFLNLLPHSLYFPIVRKMTKWDNPPSAE